MIVGVMELTMALYDNDSLKDKRSVVKRTIGRLQSNFNIAAAEVEDQDCTDHAVLGIVAVGNDRRYVQGLLDKVEHFVIKMALADVLDAHKIIENY
ncbi:MAG: DUF503 domain-containing protein [Deltaproteobacteria bacterium]|nr:DUF503 domain-containing protein [Deltaproteobacteria bacterium]